MDGMVMTDHAKIACKVWFKRFWSDRAGSIAPLFAVAAIPLTIAIGAATDVGRSMDIHSQLQDISDSAALAGLAQAVPGSEVATAQKFVTAAAAKLPGAPVVTGTYTFTQGSSTTASTLQVSLSSKVATTFAALVTPSIAVASTSTAAGSFARNVTFTINNFNSSASDLDQIYYYSIPSGMSGTTLYQWTPSLTASNLLLSNASGFSNVNKTVQIPIGTTVGFALSNTTGGVSGYGANCYGQAQGVAYVYYSHREDSAASYWDYNVPKFNACTTGSTNYWTGTIVSNGVTQLLPCNSSDASTVRQVGTCNSSQTYAAGNYVYWTDNNAAYKPYDPLYGTPYSRNPLRFGTTNTDCTQGNVTYQWDDNGGNPDDNDYNDAVFTVNCQTTAIDKTKIHLIS